MTTKVEKSVVVDAPLSTVYNQWTQFEQFPEFMGAVEQVTQLSDDRIEWVAEIGGVRRQWVAKVLEQVPDTKVAWAAVEGATNAGAVTFAAVGPDRTEVHLSMEFEPEGFVEKVGELLNLIETQAEDDLENFRRFIENSGRETGAWRGAINEGATVRTPGIEDAALSLGDSGKVGDPAEQEAAFREPADGDATFGYPAEDEIPRDPAQATFRAAAIPDHEAGNRLTETTAVGEPPVPGDRGLNPTDAASGFGDPEFEREPGVVRRDDDSR